MLLGPPVAVDDNLTTKQNTQATVFVLDNDTDPDGDELIVTSKTDPPHGTVACDQFGQCDYTPAAGYLGSDSFDYIISDGNGGTDVGTVHVSVVANSPPVAVDDTLTTKQNTQGTAFVLDNDTDANDDTLTVTGNTDPPHGTATCNASGSCTYTPDAGYLGPDSFDYTVSDGTATDTGTVNVTVVANSPARRRRRHAHDEAGHAAHGLRPGQRHGLRLRRSDRHRQHRSAARHRRVRSVRRLRLHAGRGVSRQRQLRLHRLRRHRLGHGHGQRHGCRELPARRRRRCADDEAERRENRLRPRKRHRRERRHAHGRREH